LTAKVDHFFPTLEDAVAAYRERTGAEWVRSSQGAQT
jgi:hypothetical protein